MMSETPEVDDVMSAPGPPEVMRDRRDHGGAPFHLDDDAAEDERAGRRRIYASDPRRHPTRDRDRCRRVTDEVYQEDSRVGASQGGRGLLEDGAEDMRRLVDRSDLGSTVPTTRHREQIVLDAGGYKATCLVAG